MSGESLSFYLLAGIALGCAIGVVGGARRAVASTLCLLGVTVALAGIFVVLEALLLLLIGWVDLDFFLRTHVTTQHGHVIVVALNRHGQEAFRLRIVRDDVRELAH